MKPINIAFFGIFILSFSLLIYTVVVSVSNPVQMENLFLDDYKSVDRNYGKIKKQEKLFDESVDFVYAIVKKDNIYQINIELSSNIHTSFSILSFLTRPHTNKDNANLDITARPNNKYTIILPSMSKGHWRVILKINTSSITVFKNIDFRI